MTTRAITSNEPAELSTDEFNEYLQHYAAIFGDVVKKEIREFYFCYCGACGEPSALPFWNLTQIYWCAVCHEKNVNNAKAHRHAKDTSACSA